MEGREQSTNSAAKGTYKGGGSRQRLVGGRLLPTADYQGRPRPKGLPFSSCSNKEKVVLAKTLFF